MKPAFFTRPLLAVCATVALTACPEEKPKTPATPPPAVAPTPPPTGTATTTAPGEGKAPENGQAPEGTPPAGGGAPAGNPTGALDKGTSPETREQVDPDGVVRRGVALSAEPAKDIREVVKTAATWDGKTVKLTGKVETVCSKKGCWMEVQGDTPAERVRVTAKNYGFFVPTTVTGKVATVEGELAVKTLSAEQAQHYADETQGQEGKKKINAPVQEITIVASGLELKSAT